MVDMIVTALVVLSTTIGGYVAGRRGGTSDAVGVAAQTVDLLKAQVETVRGKLDEKDLEIQDLRMKLEVLESLVTQKANVENVLTVVERIAGKVGA